MIIPITLHISSIYTHIQNVTNKLLTKFKHSYEIILNYLKNSSNISRCKVIGDGANINLIQQPSEAYFLDDIILLKFREIISNYNFIK